MRVLSSGSLTVQTCAPHLGVRSKLVEGGLSGVASDQPRPKKTLFHDVAASLRQPLAAECASSRVPRAARLGPRDMGRYGEIWGDMGRYGEMLRIWGGEPLLRRSLVRERA